MKIGKMPVKQLDIGDYDQVKDRNLGYYDNHSQEYFEMSKVFEMESFYQRFIENNIPAGGKILDAGCGSGRDALNFAKKGFDVTAFDGSANLVQICQEQNIKCEHNDFLNIKYNNQFDGVWCCAALLHLPTEAFDQALTNLTYSLKKGGVLYFSIKKLENGFLEDSAGRLFYNPGEEHMTQLFDKLGLSVESPDNIWFTGKQTEPNQLFVNYLLKKQ